MLQSLLAKAFDIKGCVQKMPMTLIAGEWISVTIPGTQSLCSRQWGSIDWTGQWQRIDSHLLCVVMDFSLAETNQKTLAQLMHFQLWNQVWNCFLLYLALKLNSWFFWPSWDIFQLWSQAFSAWIQTVWLCGSFGYLGFSVLCRDTRCEFYSSVIRYQAVTLIKLSGYPGVYRRMYQFLFTQLLYGDRREAGL